MSEHSLDKYEPQVNELFARCVANAPNIAVPEARFKASINKSLTRLATASNESVTDEEVKEFLGLLQADDLFLALGCAEGNERAWWEFDHQYRAYIERLARQLAKTDVDAQDVVDCVYVELYGTKFVDGERVSKFATYSGRGSLKSWLRTVVWHTLVDLHRASHDEVSLDELTENAGDAALHAFATGGQSDEDAVEDVARNRYRAVTVEAIGAAFASLEDHEKLLLLYYHSEQLKLREIARLIEQENSPLRRCFQPNKRGRQDAPGARIHESTVMRWLERTYSKVLQAFKSELQGRHDLSKEEIDICLDLVHQDLESKSVFQNLSG
jgi:RNA polymerase sigma-70 factor